MRKSAFSGNLAYACSFFPSIAEVCRRVGINRQQFNKYLAGQVRPSRHNMRRICDFLGVSEWEMLLDEKRFVEILAVRRSPTSAKGLAEPWQRVELLYRACGSLERYVGHYYRYFYSFGYPGRILKTLAVLVEREGKYFWKNLEIMPTDLSSGRRSTVTKYEGMAFLLGERIYILEYETLMKNSITQLMLYPSYHPHVGYLTGVQTGGPTRRGRKPAASLVLLEYLGRNIDLRRALARSGLFDENEIDDDIRRLITNRIANGNYVFEAEQL